MQPHHIFPLRRRRRRLSLQWLAALVTSLAFALALSSLSWAQAQPPNRFYGSVKINGNEQGDGTVVEAYIGTTLCGSGTVENRNGSEIYVVDVLGGGQKPNCGKDGDKVTFKAQGLDAKESGTYTTAAATRLDLTASGNPRQQAQPTVLAPGAGGTPAPAPTFTPAPTAAPAPTPTPGAAPTPPPATATAPAPTETPAETPAATPSPTVTAAPAETPTAETPVSAAPAPTTTSSRGASRVIRVVVVLAILAIGAGIGVWAYQRRNHP